MLISEFHTGIEPVAHTNVAERVVPRPFRSGPARVLRAAHRARAVAVLMSRSRDDLAVRDLRAAGLTDRVAGVTRLRAGGRAGIAQLRLQMGAARRGGKLRIGSVFQHEAAVFVQLPQEGQRSEFRRRARRRAGCLRLAADGGTAGIRTVIEIFAHVCRTAAVPADQAARRSGRRADRAIAEAIFCAVIVSVADQAARAGGGIGMGIAHLAGAVAVGE